MIHPLAPLAGALANRSVRYVLIGVSAANLYAPGGQAVFATDDFDLLLPLDPDNLVNAWAACDDAGHEVWSAGEPPDRPRDRQLADTVVARRAMTRATGQGGVAFDLALEMHGFTFEEVHEASRRFRIDGVGVPVARLLHIVASKQAANRDKDKLFLATHKDALEQLLKRSESED